MILRRNEKQQWQIAVFDETPFAIASEKQNQRKENLDERLRQTPA